MLFDKKSTPPLAERMRPQNLDDIVGQQHLVGPNGPIRRMVAQSSLPSILFWGPPGIGKTTISRILSREVNRPFKTLSAISSGVKEVREVIEQARRTSNLVLFIDEIHRFNKSQQDALLGAVEQGVITLIGATTENPSFEVNSALLSRCQVYTLKALTEKELLDLTQKVLENDGILSQRKIEIKEHEALIQLSGGDARKLLNLIQVVTDAHPENPLEVTNQLITDVVQKKPALYDKNGEQHYDIVSAFIKSIRGSDPNAAVYWLARMLEGGEDPKFIARRMLIAASEDIGNANPTAMIMATNTFQAVTMIGMPEARIILSQTAVYLATSAKSNASYMAINNAMKFVQQTGDLGVPLHLRNAPTKLMKDQGYGKGYKYAHDYPNNFAEQNYLPDEIEGTTFYEPGDNPRENDFRKRMKFFWGDKYNY
ncbi:replication-associated recombination protein A [Sediminitomix flava]|uniref:Replication-associated recombination protein A n=1 Tax=Sediminitomix flava TaxID=379075 RepID=A0A315Z8D4_SEDFL|nr:replication-associated recombination protein A [Sediminitomix flava]PWJ40185.1 putative ATPase [Sediminitomix flava]